MESCTDIPDEIRDRILRARSMVVWPIDDDPLSESYQIARYFQDQGWRIHPIHECEDRLVEEQCCRDVRLVPDDYDILLLFTPSDALPEVVNSIFNADFVPPIIWAHTGIFDQQSFDRLTEAGIIAVMDRDLMKTYKKWVDE
jgi:hypothetical protein